MKHCSLYDFPELYDSLRTPDTETFDAVFDLIKKTLGFTPRSVMDPACGPATWLSHFSQYDIYVAGNDIDSAMIQTASKKCGTRANELIVGDMCDLQFKSSPFDVSFELSGTCGLLSNEGNFRKFVQSVRDHTATGGLILMTIFFEECGVMDSFPWLVGEWGPFNVVSGGKAWLRYEVLSKEPQRKIDYVRRTVRINGVKDCPGPLVDEYEMFSWNETDFWRVISEYAGLNFCTAFMYDEPTGISIVETGRFKGETTVVFRNECAAN